VLVLGLAWPVAAAERVRVVTTIPDLKALTQAVGGDLVDVESLTRGTQNFHEAEVRPSMMLKLRRAQLLVENGAELDSWVDVAVTGANNPSIVRGAAGRIEISRGIPLLDVPTTRVDRSMGDVHPLGNPHFSLDPGLAPIITQTILDGLSRVAPPHRATFERNRAAFLQRLEQQMAGWVKTLEPVRGGKVVVYHPDFIYFLTRFGLVQVGTVEDRPGIPPSPQHLAMLIRHMQEQKVKVVLVEPWNDRKLAARVAEEAGGKALVIASSVGAVKGADDYISTVDYNVNALAAALR
jgi:zinc/manganese transport system substrate-binding protein